jgi:hypothetical protein
VSDGPGIETFASLSRTIAFQDIVWPGEALKPPEGLPEKRFIRASFLEEDPYVMLGPPNTCEATKGVLCYIVDPSETVGVNLTEEATKTNSSLLRCCSGKKKTFNKNYFLRCSLRKRMTSRVAQAAKLFNS